MAESLKCWLLIGREVPQKIVKGGTLTILINCLQSRGGGTQVCKGVIRPQCPRPVEFRLSAPAPWNSGSVPPPREFRLSAPAPWNSDYNINYMKRLRDFFISSAPATCILVNYDKFSPVPPPREFRHSAPTPLDIQEKCPRQAQKKLVSLTGRKKTNIIDIAIISFFSTALGEGAVRHI